MLEPFVLHVPEDRYTWREDLNPKIDVVRKLAVEFGAELLPLDGLFAQAATQAPAGYWAEDGAVSYTHLDVYKRQILSVHSLTLPAMP